MSGRRVIGTRTYLEMHAPGELAHAKLPDAPWRVERMLDCAPAFWRFLYSEIGREYRWVDRLPWSTEEIQAYLSDPLVSIWLLTVWGTPAGYFELRRDEKEGIEIAYFGLFKRLSWPWIGRPFPHPGRRNTRGTAERGASGSTPTRSIIRRRCRTT